MADTTWQNIMKDSVEEMMRLVKDGESYVYDVMMPSLLALQSPEQRKAFYNRTNWDLLKVRSGALWERMTNDALNLEQQDAQEQKKRLDQLDELQGQQDTAFRYQVQNRPVMGLREPGTKQDTVSTGMDLPMGVLRAGG